MSTVDTASAAPPTARASGRAWLSLAAICLVTALTWLAENDVPIALPTIGRDIGGSMDTLQWAVNGFLLAGAFIIVGGRLGDVFGRLRIFTAGTVLLLAGSVISAIASNPEILIFGRVVSGLGAAAILPTALAIIAVTFTGKQQATAIAAWVTTCWAAQAIGPLVGGVVVNSLPWQWLFWLNIPVGVVGLALVWMSTKESRDVNAERSIDMPGAITLVAAISLLSYTLVSADALPIFLTVGLGVLAVALLGVFVVIEMKTPHPLVHLSIFRRARYNGAVLANLIANLVFGAVLFFMALYLQVVEGMSPLQAGLLLLPATVPILLMNPVGTWLGNRFGPRWPTAVGMMFLAAAGLYLVMYIGDTYDTVLPAFILIGIGIGLQITPCAVTAVEDPGDAGEGVVSGVFKATSMIGGSLGVALSTAVFQLYARNEINTTLDVPVQGDVDHLMDALSGTVNVDAVASILGPSARAQISILFDDAVAAAMWPSIIAAVIGVATSIVLLKRRKTPATS